MCPGHAGKIGCGISIEHHQRRPAPTATVEHTELPTLSQRVANIVCSSAVLGDHYDPPVLLEAASRRAARPAAQAPDSLHDDSASSRVWGYRQPQPEGRHHKPVGDRPGNRRHGFIVARYSVGLIAAPPNRPELDWSPWVIVSHSSPNRIERLATN
jgi:hypothetical protein